MHPSPRSSARAIALGLALAVVACGEAAPPPPPPPPPAPPALLTPDPAAVAAPAPDSFTVVLVTSKGEIELRIRRAWAPLGADRVHYLAANGFFAGNRFFRVLPGFIAQFGLSGIPEVDAAFDRLKLADDPARITNRRGTLVFATAGPNTRTTQLFINLADNANLDRIGFAPVGEVVRGMEAVEAFYAGYGEGYPYGAGPDQGRVMREGNRYLRVGYPLLDTIATATVRP